MSTLAIVGAGRGLGSSVARQFAKQGFDISLISRDRTRIESLAADLTKELVDEKSTHQVTVRGYAADARNPASLTAALERAAAELGPIEVLQYSPLPQGEFMRPLLETTLQDLLGAVEMSIYGSVAAVHQVVPGMRSMGRGTILFVNGGPAVRPSAGRTGISVAMAGASAYAEMLNDVLAMDGIHVAQLVIPGAIEVGDPYNDPGTLASLLWDIHSKRDGFRHFSREFGIGLD